ncbi:MAG: hypothetical protein RLO81_08910 [Fulvivirga sp.]|uniref:hypothetical protein n=1 Tax=Fulvivirga sp. TaxID=1931237 RepID=UPI0032F0232E
MMKKVLIISYHFPPLNVIASYRALGFAQHLKKYGFLPTVVTHSWEGDSVNLPGNDEFSVIGLSQRNSKSKFHFPHFLIRWTIGQFDNRPEDIASYRVFKEFLFEFLKKEKIDLLIGIYSPFHHVKLCYELNKQFKIPYIVDFRDLHDNRILSIYPIPYINKLKNVLVRFYFKRWLRNALFLTATSESWASYLGKLVNVKGYQILNGYESELLNQVTEEPDSNFFLITSMGNLHECQNLELFYSGLKMFLSRVEDYESVVKVSFIGVNESYKTNIKDELRRNIDSSILKIQGRVSKLEAIRFMKKSYIIVFPNPIGIKGYYTGKIFEYIGIGRPILSFPRNKELDSLLDSAKNYYSFDSEEGVSDFLFSQFQEWKLGKKNAMHKIPFFFSREAQARILADHIRNQLN